MNSSTTQDTQRSAEQVALRFFGIFFLLFGLLLISVPMLVTVDQRGAYANIITGIVLIVIGIFCHFRSRKSGG